VLKYVSVLQILEKIFDYFYIMKYNKNKSRKRK
jgi:hypothetical protein